MLGGWEEEGLPSDGLASLPGESSNSASHFMLQGNWGELRPDGSRGSNADVTFSLIPLV